MTKRHGNRGVVKQRIRINATKDRSGYRVFRGRSYLGFVRFKKQAETFARAQETVQQPARRVTSRTYKYVHQKTTKNKTVYYGVMRVNGSSKKRTKKYFPRCATPKAAAEMVAEYLCTTPEDIKHMKKSGRESPRQSADRMACMCDLFDGWVPADLSNAISFRGQASSLQTSGPAMYVAGLIGREDRWRDALIDVWNAMPLSERMKLQWLGSRDESMAQDGARTLHDCLSLTFVLWAGWSIPKLRSLSWPVNIQKEIKAPGATKLAMVEEDRAWWRLHVHRNVMHHFSLAPFAIRMGIISKKKSSRGTLLIGTDQGDHYALRVFDVNVCMEAYQSLHTMGTLLNLLPVPRTNQDWANAQECADALAEKCNLKRAQYHWPWLVRTYLFAEMRHHGVKALKITKDWNTQELQNALKPDQNDWLAVWMSQLAGNSLKKLLRRLHFTAPLELLSVYACIMNDSGFMAYPLDQIKQHADDIRRTRKTMQMMYNKDGNPIVVVKSAIRPQQS